MLSKSDLSIGSAFVVDPDSLTKIHRLLKDRIGDVTITADLSDKSEMKFNELKSLLSYENPKKRRIKSLCLSVNVFGEKSARVAFTDTWYFSGIKVTVEARDDVAERLRNDLLNIIEGMRPWYNTVNRFSTGIIALAVHMILWLTAIAMSGGNLLGGDTQLTWRSINGFAVYIVALFAIAYVIRQLLVLVFPRAEILIGQGVTRHTLHGNIQWVIVIGFCVSIIASVVAALVVSLFQ